MHHESDCEFPIVKLLELRFMVYYPKNFFPANSTSYSCKNMVANQNCSVFKVTSSLSALKKKHLTSCCGQGLTDDADVGQSINHYGKFWAVLILKIKGYLSQFFSLSIRKEGFFAIKYT